MFAALELPEPVIEGLRSFSAAVPGTAAVRILAADSWHITLCFLGRQSRAAVPATARAIEQLAPSAPPTVTLSDPVWLPPRHPRVLAVRLADGAGELAELQERLAQALEALGSYRRESRPFLPHVTVARVRGREPVGAQPLPAPAPASGPARALTLYRSHTASSGARYEALHRAWFDGASTSLRPRTGRPAC